MRVRVNDHTVFLFPTALVINRFTAGMIRRRLKKEGIKLTRKQTALFIKELKRYKKNHSEWKLVEVSSKNGDAVTVKL